MGRAGSSGERGRWRRLGALALACAALAGVAAGCGDDGDGSERAIQTTEPLRTFAPLVELAAGERYPPVSARWFIDRSLLAVAAQEPCRGYVIAVGRTLPELRTEVTDWIFHEDLGDLPGYYRNPYDDRCEPDFDRRFYTTDLTRPHAPGPRPEGLRDGEGFFLDLVDRRRIRPDAEPALYAERRDDGDGGVRISYWMLFPMNAPPGRPRATHEGDWERIDVLLSDEGDRHYVPEAVRLFPNGPGDGQPRELPWEDVARRDGTHPMIRLARGDHAAAAIAPGDACASCRAWRAWESVADARGEPWYGFGGAWGEPGPTDATTGPLGPHGPWPTEADRERERQSL